ncbi:MAG: prohibitin family protein [Deltaproteobacteria bacterium]|nr:prohibitin family protein [Deltaproteobacteria bacterium]
MTRALLLALFLAGGCTATTEATQVGVRTVNISLIGQRGVVQDTYAPSGTYFFLRPTSEWQVFDIGRQNLEMLRELDRGARTGDDSLRFKTVDGNDISVNVTVAWSVDATMTPYVLQFVGQNTEDVEVKLIRPVARTVVRDVLNQLTSEEFYTAERRFAMAEEARGILNTLLNREGVQVEQVLLGEHKFNPTYEQVIRDMKVAEQEAARLLSETEAAREEMKRDLERAKGQVSKAIEEARGEAEKRKLKADAIFFEREQQAAAILAEKRAMAEGLTERANALAGSGGKSMVKLKVAEALKGKKIVFLPAGGGMDLRTTDVNDLLSVYGVKAASGQ